MLTVRKALPGDIDALIALSTRTIGASYRSFLGDATVDAFLGCGAVAQYCRDHIDGCIVLADGGRILGWCVTKDNLIDLMMIDADHHRQGLGSALLKHAEDTLFESHGELTLESFEQNDQANRFYARHGWRAVDRYFDADSGVYKVAMRKVRPSE
jgi:GNAT superfamily N-acetyltransferase